MKQLILVRHAKAEAHGSRSSDFERRLTEKGKRNSSIIANRIKDNGCSPDLLISSPAYRALETAEEFADVFSIKHELIRQKQAIYDEYDPAIFLGLLDTVDDNIGTIMMFGHNPSMSEFGWYMCRKFRNSMKKTAALGIGIEANNWASILPGSGKLMYYEILTDGDKAMT